MAESLYEKFDSAVTTAKTDWERNFVLPYGSAYVTARDKFQTHLDDQKKADEARKERIAGLAMFALTLCGGSLLTHVFGSACAKTLAGQFTMDFLNKQGMERAWTAAFFVKENKTAQFFVGKVWDTAADLLPDMKAKLAETSGNFPSLNEFAQNPQVIQNHLWKWVLDAYAALLATRIEIMKNIPNEKLQTDLVMALIDSPFVRTAPANTLPADTTAENIELIFYMNVIRDLDYLERVSWQDSGMGRTMRHSEKTTRLGPISASPGSADYPKKTHRYSGTERVAFDKFGSVLRNRVDELHKKRFNKVPFFLPDETISELTITRAEQKLGEFADINLTAIKGTLRSMPSNLHLSSGASGFPLSGRY